MKETCSKYCTPSVEVFVCLIIPVLYFLICHFVKISYPEQDMALPSFSSKLFQLTKKGELNILNERKLR
jgi:hypothetical protein